MSDDEIVEEFELWQDDHEVVYWWKETLEQLGILIKRGPTQPSHIELSSQDLSRNLAALITQSSSALAYEEEDSDDEIDESLLESLQRYDDICGEFLFHMARPVQATRHSESQAQSGRKFELENLILERADQLDTSFHLSPIAMKGLWYSKAIPLQDSFSPLQDSIGHFRLWDSRTDCSGRSLLHRVLDEYVGTYFVWYAYKNICMKELEWHVEQSGTTKTDMLGRSLLHVACRVGWEEGVELLLERGARAEATTIYGSLPLHYAVCSGSQQTCRLLLDQKDRLYNVDTAVDCRGNSALYYAVMRKDLAIVDLLLKNGCDPDLRHCDVPLMWEAVEWDDVDLVDIFFKNGADIARVYEDLTILGVIEDIIPKSKHREKWERLKLSMESTLKLASTLEDR